MRTYLVNPVLTVILGIILIAIAENPEETAQSVVFFGFAGGFAVAFGFISAMQAISDVCKE